MIVFDLRCGGGHVFEAWFGSSAAYDAQRQAGQVATLQAKALESSEWVGSAFPTRARAMHEGDEPHATIHGQASVAEAKALMAAGVPVAPLPLPVVPPQASN